MTPRPLKLWIVTMAGAGLLPKMPGTYGSAVTTALVWLAWHFHGPSPWILVAGLILFSSLCVAYGDWAQDFFERKDPGPVVLDEAAGICLTLLFQPINHPIRTLIAAFLAFRLFDITKPPPCRQLEKLPAGWGILMDDLAAAVYANLLCQLILRLL